MDFSKDYKILSVLYMDADSFQNFQKLTVEKFDREHLTRFYEINNHWMI
jgi:hypothetical protein